MTAGNKATGRLPAQMPTYEYTCRDCGHTFEIVQSMLDEPLTMCPECGGSLRKVFAPPAISFKGSGFYSTDHGQKSKRSGEAKGDGERSGEKTGERSGEKPGQKTGQKTGEKSPEKSGGTKDSSDDSSTTGSSEKSSRPSKKEPAAS
jgi:putative FmdB family regulatory protein